MSGKVNYIKHLQSVVERMNDDDRLSPWHISLYHALFHCWNDNRLENPVSINRNELMKLSKIGSMNTYTKTLKELSHWEYLLYEPSKNRWIGSKIYMYRFDTCSDNSGDNTTDKRTDKTAVIPVIKQVRPSLKSIKVNKEIKDNKEEKATELSKIEARTGSSNSRLSKTSFAVPELDEEKAIELLKTEARTGSSNSRRTSFQIPELEEVMSFFKENNSTGSEGENFFNYFSSNGWLVGGKAKMKDWNAAARNWINRSAQFKSNDRSLSLSKSRLNTNNDKDYSMPL